MTAITQWCDWRFFCRDFRLVLQAHAGTSYKTIGAATVAVMEAVSLSVQSERVPTNGRYLPA